MRVNMNDSDIKRRKNKMNWVKEKIAQFYDPSDFFKDPDAFLNSTFTEFWLYIIFWQFFCFLFYCSCYVVFDFFEDFFVFLMGFMFLIILPTISRIQVAVINITIQRLRGTNKV